MSSILAILRTEQTVPVPSVSRIPAAAEHLSNFINTTLRKRAPQPSTDQIRLVPPTGHARQASLGLQAHTDDLMVRKSSTRRKPAPLATASVFM